MSSTLKQVELAPSGIVEPEAISQLSKELVIGLVGYVGAGCSTVAGRLELLLENAGYVVHASS